MKKLKFKKMTRGKFYRKQGWKITQLTKRQQTEKGYRIKFIHRNKCSVYYWLNEYDFKKQYNL